MKIKKICSVLISLTFILGGNAFAAESERIKFGAVNITENAEVTTVELPLLTKPAEKSAVLIAAYIHKDTGRVLSVNAQSYEDVSLIAEDSLKVTVENKEAEDGELSYYVWNSLSDGATLLNNSPAAPLSLDADATISKAELSWDAPEDDYDEAEDLKYNIYQDGMLLKEDSTKTEYTAQNLAWGSSYGFEAAAKDTEGALSSKSTVNIATPYKNTALTASDITLSPDGNLEFTGSETKNTMYFYCEKGEAGGLACYKTALRPKDGAGTYLSYKFADDYFSELSGVKKFVCELTYFDEGTEDIKTEWWRNATEGIKYVTLGSKTNTSTWKTIRKTVSFATASMEKNPDKDGSANFNIRIQSADKNVGLKVRRFSVLPIYEDGTVNEYDTVIKKNAGAYITVDGATVGCDMKSTYEGKTPEKKGARDGVKIAKGNAFDFTVTDTSLQSGNVKVYVTYRAEDEKANIFLGDVSKKITAAQKWQTMCFDIENIGSGQKEITADKDIYINCVRVVSAD